uniref:Uncharacterized protein n=1 Tax=viral metagenome TaxID=1070528 RepID=A0A6C0J5T2_9ZZZZ
MPRPSSTAARSTNLLNTQVTSRHFHAMDHWDAKFPLIAQFVRAVVFISVITDHIKQTVVKAAVKAGKRLVAECFAAYTSDPSIINIFISAYARKADSSQREQLADYMTGGVFSINTEKNAIECRDVLRNILRVNPSATIVVHFDEFDHGCGSNQLVNTSGLWDLLMNSPNVRIIEYSASPEEGLLGEDVNRRCCTMPAHPDYRGAQYYLRAGLVTEAEAPLGFDEDDNISDLSDQVKTIITAAKTQMVVGDIRTTRPLVIIRITDGFKPFQAAYSAGRIPFLDYDADDLDAVPVDVRFVASTSAGTHQIQWDSYDFWKREMTVARRAKSIVVVFIDQVCTRSTDWFCHPFLYAYHDYHDKSAINTIIQASLRASYYIGKKNDRGESVYGMEDHPIQLFADIDIVRYVAGEISLDEVNRRVSSRAGVQRADPTEWGRPIRVQLRPEQVVLPCFTTQLRSGDSGVQQRAMIKQILLAADGLDNMQREILAGRNLATKRTYRANNLTGGIHHVHDRWSSGRSSKPGGGIPSDWMFDQRHSLFWIDIAQENTNGIPAGTVYITYGLVSDDDGETYTHHLRNGPGGRSLSIFGLPR